MITRTQALMLMVTFAAALSFALARVFLLEDHTVGQLCVSVSAPVWCGIRLVVLKQCYLVDGLGVMSLGAGIVCLFFPRSWLILGTLMAGVGGVLLFRGDTTMGGTGISLAALGTILGFIALARSGR